MIFILWNIRGMNDPFKIKEIKNFLTKNKVVVCVLLETRVRENNANKFQKKIGKDWMWVCNYSHSPRGRIWIGWRNAWVNVTLDHTQEQDMVCLIQDKLHKMTLVVVYDLHTISDMRGLWRELLDHVQHQDPMIIIGDYNAVCHSNDRANGALVTDAETEDFEDFLLNSSLIEARTAGLFYSWSNSSVGSKRVVSRIDKAFVNQARLRMYAVVCCAILSTWDLRSLSSLIYFAGC